ncbi:hypothetical protein [Nonomuraea sp. NPDC003804]|uniref:hypothetical protein n=1 Tax=Nonomuraea sp. NPDC003804 TaxID=3154547 RepID=UPI0033A5502A
MPSDRRDGTRRHSLETAQAHAIGILETRPEEDVPLGARKQSSRSSGWSAPRRQWPDRVAAVVISPFSVIWISRGPSRRVRLGRFLVVLYITNVMWKVWEIYQSNPAGFMPYVRGEKDVLPLLYLPPPLVTKSNLSPWIDRPLLAIMLVVLFWAVGPHNVLKVALYLLIVLGIAMAAPISRVSVNAAVESAMAWWLQTAWPWLAQAAASSWTALALGLLLAAACLVGFTATCLAVVHLTRELIADEMHPRDVARCFGVVVAGAIAAGVIVELAAWSVHLMRHVYAFPDWLPFLWTVFLAGLAATTAVTADMVAGQGPGDGDRSAGAATPARRRRA